MRSAWRWPLIVSLPVCTLGVSGCMKYELVIHVKPDGSGQIHETFQFNMALMQGMMQGMMGAMGGEAGEEPKFESDEEPWEEVARKKAGDFGPGVELVEASKETKEGWEVRKAVYAFRDVTALCPTSEQEAQATKPPAGLMDVAENPPVGLSGTFGIRRIDARTAELTITLPPPEEEEEPSKAEGEPKEAEEPGAGQMPDEATKQFIQQIFKDMDMLIAIECGGEILETNATYREGNRITLAHIAFDDIVSLMTDPQKVAELQSLGPKPQNIEALQEMLRNIPGLQFEVQPEVKVKFR
ncbi:MAG: hypothetical protein ACE5O2_04710 [Armatimonadota bacterium]